MHHRYLFQLLHERIVGLAPDGDEILDKKELGLYSSRANAMAAQQSYAALTGFRDYPDGFSIKRRRICLKDGVQLLPGMPIYHLTHARDAGDYDVITDMGFFASTEAAELAAKGTEDAGACLIGELLLDAGNPYWSEGFCCD